VHVPVGDRRVVRNEGHAPRRLHVVDWAWRANATNTAGTNRTGVAVRGRAVRQECDFALARGDIALGMGGVELVGAAPNRGGVDDVRLEAHVLGEAEARHSGPILRVVESVDILPAETGVFERTR